MKKTILLSVAIFTFTLCVLGQSTPTLAELKLPEKEGKIYWDVIDTASGDKGQLFAAASKMLMTLFEDSKAVLNIQSREDGLFAGKANFVFKWRTPVKLSATLDERIRFTFEIAVKDGKYRIKAYDFIVVRNNSNLEEIYTKGIMKSPKYREEFLTAFKGEFEIIMKTMQDGIKSKVADNW